MKRISPKVSILALLLMFSSCNCNDDTPRNDVGVNNSNNGNNSRDGGNQKNNANNGTRDAGQGRDVFLQPDIIFTLNDMGQVLCKDGNPCACSDGIDNDGDGLIDGFDPECTGPFDDDEETFATGIPGDNKDPKWQDCFFDGNSGAGDDKCRYHTDCLTGAKDPTDKDCELSQACIDFCRPRTPNGCDCFGCCEVFDANGSSTTVVIGGTCSTADLSACSTCIQSQVCLNPCGECELCLGKTIADLPATCGGGGGNDPPQTCESGAMACNRSAECQGDSFYCFQGCCQFIPG